MTPTVHEIAPGIHRISTFVPEVSPDGFTFNQFLVAADEPLLFHTGPRGMFPLVSEAINQLVPVARAKVSLRTAPGQDTNAALEALKKHLEEHADQLDRGVADQVLRDPQGGNGGATRYIVPALLERVGDAHGVGHRPMMAAPA